MPTSAARTLWSRSRWRSRIPASSRRAGRSTSLSGDHQNKPDVGVNIARQWIDNDKVDAIADTPNSGVALAVNNLAGEKNSVLLNSGAASADLTGKACTPNTVSFTYDTYDARQRHRQGADQGRRRQLVLPDRGLRLRPRAGTRHLGRRDRERRQGAGRRQGLRSTPPTSRRFLLQAQASKAKVIGLANAGGDTTNSIKQAAEFGIVAGGQKLAGAAAVHQRRAFAGPEDRAGPDVHRVLLLGHERRRPAPGRSASPRWPARTRCRR